MGNRGGEVARKRPGAKFERLRPVKLPCTVVDAAASSPHAAQDPRSMRFRFTLNLFHTCVSFTRMLQRCIVSLIGVALIGCAAASNAEARRPVAAPERSLAFTPEQLVSLSQTSDAHMSPSGHAVVYAVRSPQPLSTHGGSRTAIYLLDVESGDTRRLTSTMHSSWAPRWSPDGAKISFLSRRESHDKHTQVFTIDPAGGEATPMTEVSTGIRSYTWSPTGDRIAYTATRSWTEEERQAHDSGRDWVINETNTRGSKLFIFDPLAGTSTPLTDDAHAINSFAWAPDGKTLVVSASTSASVDATMMYSALFTVSVAQPTLNPLTKTEGKLGRVAWSPDGTQIAFLGARDIHDSTAGTLFVVPARGGEARALTATLEGTGQWVGWKDANTIVLSSHERTESTVRLVDLKRGSSKLLVEDGPTCRALSFAADREHYACSGSRPSHPPEIFSGSFKRNPAKRLTISNPELERTILGEQRVFNWTAKDGTALQGVLILPTNFKQGTRYPLAVLPHGGPEGVSLNGWNTRATYPAQIFASEGYVVFEPNYRGSSGRGTSFAVADQRDLGGLEFEDVLSGIDALVAEGFADADRVGMGGWSYGGYFSGLAATRWTKRFKASVIAAAVTDWMSFTGTTEIEHENSLVHWNLWPYDQPEKVWDRSPMGHTNDSQTASLIVHGLADTRVPPSQSTELYRALKHAGAPVELVMYPREPHGLRENVHQLDFVERFVGWFNRYVRDTKSVK